MDSKIVKIIGNVLKFSIGLLGLILCLMMLFKGVSGKMSGVLDFSIYFSMFLVILAAVIALIFGVVYFVGNIKKGLGAVIGLGALLVIFGIGYGMSNGNLMDGWAAEGVTENISRLAGMGIWAFLLLIVIAIVAALASEVIKLIK